MNKNRTARGIRALTTAFALLVALLLQACTAGNATSNQTEGKSAAATTSASSNASAAKAPSQLRVGYIGANKINYPNGAEGWGFYKGIITEELKKYGITDIQFVGFPSGPDLNESLISGRLDVGFLGDTPSLLVRSTGAKTRLFAQPTIKTNIYLIGKKNGPKTISDLKGKTVGTQKGSILHRYAVGTLKQNGILESAKLIHSPTTDVPSLLARGDIDAATVTGANAQKLSEQGYPILGEASKTPLLLGTSTSVVSEDYLKKFPDFPKVFNEIRAKAYTDLKAKPDEYYNFLVQSSGNTLDVVKFTSPIEEIADVPFTKEGLEQLEEAKKFLIEEKLIEKDFSIQDWIIK